MITDRTFINDRGDLLWQGGGYEYPCYARRVAQLTQSAVILAPSGTGKSHFCRANPEDAIDGDAVISAALGWPEKIDHATHHWSKVEANHWSHWVALLTAAALDPLRRPVLFNGRAWTRPRLLIVQVLPPNDRMAENIRMRVTPETFNLAWKQWLEAREGQLKTGFPTFQSFEKAIDFIDDSAGIAPSAPALTTQPKRAQKGLYGTKV